MPTSSFNFESTSSISSTPSADADDEYPEDRFLQQMTASRASSTTSEPSAPIDSTLPDTTPHDEGALGLNSLFPGLNTRHTTFNTVLPHFGSLIKRSAQLSPSAEAKLDLYCETAELEERLALQYGLSLEIWDLLKQVHKPENWTISDELKKTIGSYVKAFLLSPTITAYRGNCAEQILKAMTDLNIGDLPPKKNVLQVTEVLSFISNQLTSFRAVIKQKLQASLVAPKNKASNTRNIADLTHALIANTAVLPTYQLWMRMAFLRFHLVTYPKSDYWAVVDETLERWRSRATDARALSQMFNLMYEDDKKKYGDPAETRHEPVQPKNLPGWLRTIDNHSMKVKAPASASSVAAGKRKRVELEVEDNE